MCRERNNRERIWINEREKVRINESVKGLQVAFNYEDIIL